jgi:hypothetical protein
MMYMNTTPCFVYGLYQQPCVCSVCVIFFARVVVTEHLRRARRGVRGGPTYFRRADIFPGRHISGTT